MIKKLLWCIVFISCFMLSATRCSRDDCFIKTRELHMIGMPPMEAGSIDYIQHKLDSMKIYNYSTEIIDSLIESANLPGEFKVLSANGKDYEILSIQSDPAKVVGQQCWLFTRDTIYVIMERPLIIDSTL